MIEDPDYQRRFNDTFLEWKGAVKVTLQMFSETLDLYEKELGDLRKKVTKLSIQTAALAAGMSILIELVIRLFCV